MPIKTPLDEARRLEKLTQAKWRRSRAEVARLIAAGEEAAARRLLAEIGECPPEVEHQAEPKAAAQPLWEGSPDPDYAPPAVTATKPQSASGDASHKLTQSAIPTPRKRENWTTDRRRRTKESPRRPWMGDGARRNRLDRAGAIG